MFLSFNDRESEDPQGMWLESERAMKPPGGMCLESDGLSTHGSPQVGPI